MKYDIDRIYRAYKYCFEKCKMVYEEGQIKGFVALIFNITAMELTEIINIKLFGHK